MSALEFVAALVDSLAWPVGAILLALIFRKSLGRVIESLSSLRYKDFSADFEKQLSEIEEAEQQLPPRTVTSLEPSTEASKSLEDEIEQVAAISPAAAIPLAWALVEHALQRAVQRLSASEEFAPHNSALQNLRLLRHEHLIDEETSRVLDRMRTLRNIAVHDVRDHKIPPSQAVEFSQLARRMVSRLESLRSK